MAIMIWSDALSVNIKEMDDHHKKTVSMVNQLHEAMLKGDGKIVVGPILTESNVHHISLLDYSYPSLQTHGSSTSDS